MNTNPQDNDKVIPVQPEAPQAEIPKVDVFDKYIEWSSLPALERAEMLGIAKNPVTGKYTRLATNSDFADKFGVHRNTLGNWRQKSDFIDAVRERIHQRNDARTPDVLDALYRRCIKFGMANDVELWLAYTQGWSRQTKIKIIERFADDDLRRIINALPQEKQREFYLHLNQLYFDYRAVMAERATPQVVQNNDEPSVPQLGTAQKDEIPEDNEKSSI